MLHQHFNNPIIQICNRALRLLNHSSITSLEDGTTEAEACKFLYANVKAELLSSYPWKATIKSVVLSPIHLNSEQHNNLKLSFQYKFILPTDCLRIISLNGSNNYMKDGLYLYAYTNVANLNYISNIKEEEFNISFSYLLSLKLALEMSYNLTGGVALIKHFNDLFNEEYKKLIHTDSLNGTSATIDEYTEPSWITSRY
jgi:hypothetical protein